MEMELQIIIMRRWSVMGEPKISGDELKLYYSKVEVYDNNSLVYSTNYSDAYELYKKYR